MTLVSVQNESHLQCNAITNNPVILDDDLLFLDPGALDVLYGLGCFGDAVVDGSLKADVGLSYDFDDFCNVHG